MKTVKIKGKDYVEVNERLKYFRSEPKFKDYSLESEIISLDKEFITIKAIIKDGNGRVVATGLAQEKAGSTYINETSFVENCETSAWGRALGNLGIGIDTSVASAEEVQNAIENQKPKEKPKLPQSLDEYRKDMEIISTIEDLKAYGSGIKQLINSNKELNKIYWDRYEVLNAAESEASKVY